MTKKEFDNVIVNAVEYLLNIHNGYCLQDTFIVDNTHEMYHTIEPLDNTEEIIYCIDADKLNAQIDPVIEQVEELLDKNDTDQLHQLAIEIAGSYVSCDDDYYEIINDLRANGDIEDDYDAV
jgi:CTP synthase (UTP-ammonia lyase)